MKSRLGFLKATIALVFLLLLSNCAYIDQSICLKYSSNEHSYPGQRGKVALSIKLAGGVKQNENGLWIIGSLNDRDGLQQAELLSSRNPADWINEAITLELTRAGFNVIHDSPLPLSLGQTVRVEEINLFMNLNRDTGRTDVNHLLKLDVDLLKDGTRIRSFSVTSQLKNHYTTCVTSREEEELIQTSLRDAVRQILAEINK